MCRFGRGAPLGFLQEAEPIPEEHQIPEAPVNNGLHLSVAFEQTELHFLSVMTLCILPVKNLLAPMCLETVASWIYR